MTDFNAQLARAVKDLIKDLGLTQAAVAREIEQSTTYVSDRISGRMAVTADIVVGIAALSHMQPTTIWRELMSRIENQQASGA
jgi:plasmid maintenance system antidote protein VapI